MTEPGGRGAFSWVRHGSRTVFDAMDHNGLYRPPIAAGFPVLAGRRRFDTRCPLHLPCLLSAPVRPSQEGFMTTFIKNKDAFAHSTMGDLRLILRSYLDQWWSLEHLAMTPKFGGDERDVLAIMHEAAEAGLLELDGDGFHAFKVTNGGKAIAMSRAGRPLERSEAMKLVEKVRVSATAFNEDKASPITIRGIWLFGSLVQGAAEVGDVDIAFDIAKAEWVPEEFDEFHYIHTTYPGLVSTAPWEFYNVTGHFLIKKLFGHKRPTRISITDIDRLKNMHCKCAVIFSSDRDLSGEEFEVLDHHPQSYGRSPTLAAPLSMPEIPKVRGIRPTSAQILATTTRHDLESFHLIVSPDDRRIADFPLLGNGHGFDGTDRFGIVFGEKACGYQKETRRPYGIIVERHAKQTAETISLKSQITICGNSDAKLNTNDFGQSGRVLDILHGADLLRFSHGDIDWPTL